MNMKTIKEWHPAYYGALVILGYFWLTIALFIVMNLSTVDDTNMFYETRNMWIFFICLISLSYSAFCMILAIFLLISNIEIYFRRNELSQELEKLKEDIEN